MHFKQAIRIHLIYKHLLEVRGHNRSSSCNRNIFWPNGGKLLKSASIWCSRDDKADAGVANAILGSLLIPDTNSETVSLEGRWHVLLALAVFVRKHNNHTRSCNSMGCLLLFVLGGFRNISSSLPSQCLQRLARGSPSDPVLTGMVQLRLTRHPGAVAARRPPLRVWCRSSPALTRTDARRRTCGGLLPS